MTFKITQQDSSPSLLVTLGDGANPVDLSTASDVRFIMQDRYERVVTTDDVQGSVNIVDSKSGEVEYVFDQTETSDAGTYEAEFEVMYNNGSIETFPANDRKIQIEIVEQIA